MSEKSAYLVRNLLNRHHLSIAEFARLTSLSRATIHKYLKGEPIRPHSARKISNSFKDKFGDWVPYEKFIE
jgi:transcriptional regulator with XRE-family HTH domain